MASMYADHAEKLRIWRRNNPEAYKAHCARRDKSALHAANKRWREKNLEAQRERAARWARENPELAAEAAARRRARHRLATPCWSDKSLIRDLYKLAAIYREFCFPVEVDHLVPLRSAIVCGLHVPSNLRVIPAVENNRKGNRWWPDMPEVN